MKYIAFLWLGLLLSGTTELFGQKNEVQKRVHEAVQNYYQGYLHNEAAPLAKAFDLENGHLKALQKDSASARQFVRVYPMQQVAERWVSKKPFSDAQKAQSHLKILSTDILQEQLAVVKVELKAGEKVYIDYLSLYQVNGEWKIVNKVFVELPEKAPKK